MKELSHHFRFLKAVQKRLREIGLDGIDPDSIVMLQIPELNRRWVPSLPGILVAPFGQEVIEHGGMGSEDIGYPVTVAVVDSARDAQDEGLNRRLLWREKIIDEMIHRRLDDEGVDNSSHFDVGVEPFGIVDTDAWFNDSVYLSALVLRCTLRKQRRRKR